MEDIPDAERRSELYHKRGSGHGGHGVLGDKGAGHAQEGEPEQQPHSQLQRCKTFQKPLVPGHSIPPDEQLTLYVLFGPDSTPNGSAMNLGKIAQ